AALGRPRLVEAGSGTAHGMSLAFRATPPVVAGREGTMRISRTVALGGIAALLWVLGASPARAEDQAPADPTRGQWDSFLDPLRDFEDNYVTATQKSVEDATKIHVSAAFQKGFTYDFGTPKQGTPLPYDSFEYHDSPSIDAAQLKFTR